MAADIWLGDVVKAWVALGATSDAERRLIAELLGFHLPVRIAPATQTPIVPSAPRPPSPAAEQPGRVDDVVPERPAAADAAPLVVPLGTPVETQSASTITTPTWQVDAVPLAPETAEHVRFAPPFEPLFEARWTRAIVGALCGTSANDGPLDMDEIVDRLARGLALKDLPRERVMTLRRGVQLLIDHSDSMVPFMRDVDMLSRRIVDIVGRDRTKVLRFSGSLQEGAGPAGPSTWKKYAPPPSGTPVVLLTDLGMTRGARMHGAASREEWLEIGRSLASRQCPAIAIVPLQTNPRHRLARSFRIVPWDRQTAVWQARRVATGEQV